MIHNRISHHQQRSNSFKLAQQGKQMRDSSTSPMSVRHSAASTTFSDSCSQNSDFEEFKMKTIPALPTVMEKRESVFERQEYEEQYQNQMKKLDDKCKRQAAEVEKVEGVRLMADYCKLSCQATMDKIDNFINQGREDLNHQANVIFYGKHYTTDEDGNVTMKLKDAHSMGGVVALACQSDLREAKRERSASKNRAQSSSRKEREERAEAWAAERH